jgi:hypothetical protein
MPSTQTAGRPRKPTNSTAILNRPDAWRWRTETPPYASFLSRRPAPKKSNAAAPPTKPIQNNPEKPRPLPPTPRPPSQTPVNPPPARKEPKSRWSHLVAGAPRFRADEVAPIPAVPALPSAKAQARAILAATKDATRPMRVERPSEDTPAGAIIAAAEKARSKTRNLLPAKGSIARRILDAGARRRGEQV